MSSLPPSAASRIRVLPDHVANQIAAGEVVERPVAVVKELVENSLDAGATRIEIEFQQGGKRLIRVEDNGCGMSPDDALLCLERHATSKIKSAGDILHVLSFGFRGEALPSIASVSRFRLCTRGEGCEQGTEVLMNGGRIIERREVGMPQGTCIEVAQLFNSLPARRKFLKTDKTEAAHITQLCRLLAMAHPEVSFTLIEDGRQVFQSPICPSLRERVGEVFGRSIAEELMEIEREHGGLRLHGLIGKPGSGRSTRQEMLCYVNLRPVDSRTLNYALIEAYHSYLPKGRYPLAFLFLDIEPEQVDVNVHPAKREVRFREEGAVRRFVMESLLARLDEVARGGLKPSAPAQEPSASQRHQPAVLPSVRPRPQAPSVTPACQPEPVAQGESKAARLLRERGLEPSPKPVIHPRTAAEVPAPAEVVAALPAPQVQSQRTPSRWRFLGCSHGDYALFESPAGIVCMNRRAAQVRVLYEDFLNTLAKGSLASQSLLFPITFELDPLLSDTLEEHIGFFQENGFGVEPFGRNAFRITSIPSWFDSEQSEAFVRDVAGLIHERGLRPKQEAALARHTLARMAAVRAARLDSSSSEAEMNELLRRLLACENPLADPQGRATYFELGKSELERRFS